MKKCCDDMDLIFDYGDLVEHGSKMRGTIIRCKSCGKSTSSKTDWYHANGRNDVEVKEVLINEWNNGQ